MKKILLYFFFFLFSLQICLPQTTVDGKKYSIVFTWDHPEDFDQITGYRIYKQVLEPGQITPSWQKIHDFPKNAEDRFVFPTTPDAGIYVVTAYNLLGESEMSDPVVLPSIPKKLNVKLVLEFEH